MFIIAGREFLDFAVFLLFILVVLCSAIFAFFQLTGGNYQFLRFGDGLAVMTRLTFGRCRLHNHLSLGEMLLVPVVVVYDMPRSSLLVVGVCNSAQTNELQSMLAHYAFVDSESLAKNFAWSC